MERSVDSGGRQGGATGDVPGSVSEPAPPAYAPGKSEVRDLATARAAQRRRAPTWLAMAATLVLGLGLGWIGTRSFTPSGQAPELVASPTRVIYDTMRGEATPPRVEHADSKSPYVLIEVAVPPGAQDITLKMGDVPEQKLTPLPDGFVSFLVERNRMHSSGRLSYALQGNTLSQQIDIPQSVQAR